MAFMSPKKSFFGVCCLILGLKRTKGRVPILTRPARVQAIGCHYGTFPWSSRQDGADVVAAALAEPYVTPLLR